MIRWPEPAQGALGKLMAQHTQTVERLAFERDRAREASAELRDIVARTKEQLAQAHATIRQLRRLA